MLYGKHPLAYIMLPDLSVSIDDIEDIWLAERKILKSTLRYFLRGRLLEDEHWSKLREFLVTAMFMAEISRNLIEQLQPDALIISHGIYVTWGVLHDLEGYVKNRRLFGIFPHPSPQCW